MSGLTDFLLARIAEDEAHVGAVPHHIAGTEAFAGLCGIEATSGRICVLPERHLGSAARVLAECEAKRRIVERCSAVDYAMPSTHLAHGILAEIALPYADHPDYREEWKP